MSQKITILTLSDWAQPILAEQKLYKLRKKHFNGKPMNPKVLNVAHWMDASWYLGAVVWLYTGARHMSSGWIVREAGVVIYIHIYL